MGVICDRPATTSVGLGVGEVCATSTANAWDEAEGEVSGGGVGGALVAADHITHPAKPTPVQITIPPNKMEICRRERAKGNCISGASRLGGEIIR